MLTSEASGIHALLDPFSEHAVGSWFLLRTRARQERIVANDFAARGVTHCLPLINCVRYYGNRKMHVDVPLFAGYVFLRGSASDAYSLERSGRLAQIIPIADQKRVNKELKNICAALSNNADFSQYSYLSKGVSVQVRSGPFRGLCGIIEDLGKRNRLILQVEILGRAVSLEVDGALLDVID